jgi:hypothetical protein
MRRGWTKQPVLFLAAALAACSGRIEGWDTTNANGRGPNGEFVPGGGGAAASNAGGASGNNPGGGASGNNPGGGAGGASGSAAAAQCNGELAAGPALMRRLSQTEYNNTVRDLLDDTSALADDFVADGKVGLFENNAYSPMTSLLATQYSEAAETLANAAMGKLGALAGCSDETQECARTLITTLGKRAYRRPLKDDEITRLLGLYDQMRAEAEYDHANASRVVIQALLQSPQFLYHVEEGDPTSAESAAGASALTSYEVASRLSYLLWATMPDRALFDAADSGVLGTPEGLRLEAERMLADEKTREGVLRFYRQWLGIYKLPTLTKSTEMFPAWNDALKAAAQNETETLIDHVVWQGDGRLHTLLTAPFSFLNEQLASVYEVAGVSGDELRMTTVDPARRAGILSHISILATTAHSEQTSPVHRGKLIRERFLCDELPSPPPEVDVTPPKANPSLTTAERYAQHSKDPYCAGCHVLMDPIGLGFESYDAIGAFRSEENGKPVTAAGEVHQSDDADGKFTGLIELTSRLSESRDVHDCVADNWFAYSVGRNSKFPEDVCSVEGVREDFSASGGNLKEILLAVIGSDGFRFRRPIQVEEETCQ